MSIRIRPKPEKFYIWRNNPLVRTLSFIFFLFLTIQAVAQPAFNKTHGTSNSEEGKAVLQLWDRSFISVGSSSGMASLQSQVYLLKTDSSGNYLWSKHFGGSGIEQGYDIVQTADSGFIICGLTNSTGGGGYDIYLLKTDSSGNVEWEKTFGSTDWEMAYAIKQGNDGNYIVAGETYSYGSGLNDGFVFKINDSGDSLWMKTYGGSGNEIINDIISAGNTNLVACGKTNSKGKGNYDAWFLVLDDTGKVLTDTTYGSTLYDEFTCVDEDNSNRFFLGGSSDSGVFTQRDMVIYHLFDTGNLVNQIYLGGNGEDEVSDIYVDQVTSHLFILGSTNSYGLGQKDGIIYHLDAGGWYVAGPSFGTPLENYFHGFAPNATGGIIITGTTNNDFGITDLWLLNVDYNMSAPSASTSNLDATSTNEISIILDEVFVYPNPGNEFISIQLKEKSLDKIEIVIFDMLGNIVLKSNNISEIPVYQLASGIYTIHIFSDKNFAAQTRFSKT